MSNTKKEGSFVQYSLRFLLHLTCISDIVSFFVLVHAFFMLVHVMCILGISTYNSCFGYYWYFGCLLYSLLEGVDLVSLV